METTSSLYTAQNSDTLGRWGVQGRRTLRDTGYDSPPNYQGAQYGQSQTTTGQGMAGVGPTHQSGATGGGGDSPVSGRVPGSQRGILQSVGDVARQTFPGVSATLRGAGEDMADAWNQGKKAKAVGGLLRNSIATIPFAAVDDVVGGFGRGAYNLLRNPAEDAFRGFAGLPDRVEQHRTSQPVCAD